jgi:benzoyl-CoA 2,3-dioxygenase component B
MSQEDTLVEDNAMVNNDKFVEVNYDDAIPNNVDLSSDRQLLRAPGKLAPQLHRLVERHGS